MWKEWIVFMKTKLSALERLNKVTKHAVGLGVTIIKD